jgi:hypothetical protein
VTQKCGAERPLLKPMGWECMGTGLTIIMRGPQGVPVVVPTVLLGVIGEANAQVMRREGGPRPFTGGDHLHAVLPMDQTVRDAVTETGLYLR